MKLKKIASVLLFACIIASGAVHATIAQYQIELLVNAVSDNPNCAMSTGLESNFGCVNIGDIFLGRFGVDSSILSTDGIVTTAAIFDFKLVFGNALYSTGPDNLTLAGFRNPGIGASAPGFVIDGGEVVDLYGGVFGGGDYPFIDMYVNDAYRPRNTFYANDGFGTSAQGSLSIHRISEPSNVALIGIALSGLALSRRRRASLMPPGFQSGKIEEKM